jgi:soluble lytic murein transglycosylase
MEKPTKPNKTNSFRRLWLTFGGLCLLASTLALPSVADARASSLEAQRKIFVAAETAYKKGRLNEYKRLKKQLGSYPLKPYLEYEELRDAIRNGRATTTQIRTFLQQYDNTRLAERIRNAWLQEMAQKQRWSEYLDFYHPSKSTAKRCEYLKALIATDHAKIAFAQVEQIWLVGRSQPALCDPVFNAWNKAGHLQPPLVWQRVALAMENGQVRLARYLKKFLGKADHVWIDRWIALREQPAQILDRKVFSAPHAMRNRILLYGLNRLARTDAKRATAAWQTLRQDYRFNTEEIQQGERSLAVAYIRHNDPDVLARLDNIKPRDDDLYLHHKRILTALENEDWERALFWIDELPKDERQAERWRYWQGRALQKLGRSDEALTVLTEVAQDRTYYAFLAADRIGAEYFLEHIPLSVDPQSYQRLANSPAARRTFELRALGRTGDARSEWWWMTRLLSPAGLKAAAKLAKSWQWHDQAIFTLARSDYWDDLELRFPLEHLDLVEKHADSNGIQVPWVLAVMRQESAFSATARSHAGAMGLMQLMPATARQVSKRLGNKAPKQYELLRPETNIPLGTAYLGQVLERLDQHPVLATAAYNAGPHRVKKWLPERTLEADIWVETIPFKETRNYVKRVMAYAVIYEMRLGLEPGSIVERMRAIPNKLGAATTSAQTHAKDSRT